MKRFISILFFTLIGISGFIASWLTYPNFRSKVSDICLGGKFKTLEIRHSAESIMEAHKKELLKDGEHAYLEPGLQFHPYLLMEVKYTRDKRTQEGIILWSLVDGEMVIDTHTWEKTHGFHDCIDARADHEDFRILNVLSSNGGALDRESLSKILNVDNPTLDRWIDKCRTKSLIVQTGNLYRLHLQNPRMQVLPETHLDQWLVTKESKKAERVAKRFSPSQIESMAKIAFGNDFAIRKTSEIFLPVYGIAVQNPDGSQMTSYWNALNGKRLSLSLSIE